MYYKRGKYGNKKTPIDGHIFDSKKEAERYIQLRAMQKQGDISGLELQKKFILIPTQRGPDIIGPRGGRKPGELIFSEISYTADFVYYDERSKGFVVEDVKGYRTDVYKLKKAMMYWIHGIEVREV